MDALLIEYRTSWEARTEADLSLQVPFDRVLLPLWVGVMPPSNLRLRYMIDNLQHRD